MTLIHRVKCDYKDCYKTFPVKLRMTEHRPTIYLSNTNWVVNGILHYCCVRHSEGLPTLTKKEQARLRKLNSKGASK